MRCPNCGEEKSRLGQHWAMSCSFPKISDRNKLILEGILLGDGHVPDVKGNSQMRIRMTNEDFLHWLDSELSYMSNGVRFVKSAKESAEQNRKSGLRPNAKEENYNDVYELNTRTHPYFTKLRELWYTPDKTYKEELVSFEPELIKMWYVTDGYLCERENHNPYSAFRLDSQSESADDIVERFINQGINCTSRDGGNVIAISPLSTMDFLEWIGSPPDGFSYKWVNYE